MSPLDAKDLGSDPAKEVDARDEFAVVRGKVTAIGIVALVLLLVIVLVGEGALPRPSETVVPMMFLGILLFVFVLAAIGIAVYRCPSCRGYPGRGFWGFPRHCQNCGAVLQ